MAALLVVGILAAQTLTLLHKLDPVSHAADQSCELCIAASVFGGANVASPVLPGVDSQSVPVSPTVSQLRFRTTARHFEARAPPFAS